MNDLTFCIPILPSASHPEITMCLGIVLILFLACNTISLLMSLIGNGNNMVLVKAAAQQQEQSPSPSLPSSLSYGDTSGNSIMNFPSSYSQQLLLPPPEIFDRVKSSVVQITPLPSSQGQNASLLGSGFVMIEKDTYLQMIM
jgi:hypothetical protein